MAFGDHLFVSCGAYTHHGIDCGDGQVIHFDSTPWQKLIGEDRPERPAMIKCVSNDEFSKGREIFVRDYRSCDRPQEVVARAWSRVGEQGYSLFDNNCEHFAVWCKTGRAESEQVRALMDFARPLAKNLPLGIAIARVGNRLPGKVRLAFYGTALTITAGSTAAEYIRNRRRYAESRESS